jgi:hypothetical protein
VQFLFETFLTPIHTSGIIVWIPTHARTTDDNWQQVNDDDDDDDGDDYDDGIKKLHSTA